MAVHHGWLFSTDLPPVAHVGGVFPKIADGYINPWLYLSDTDRWYQFNRGPFNWEARKAHQAPAQYRAALLILPKE